MSLPPKELKDSQSIQSTREVEVWVWPFKTFS